MKTLAMEGALSPIRRIPPEILAEVFIFCRDSSLDAASYYISDPREAPMLLAHICSSWRLVCHGTPRLWQHVHLRSAASFRKPSFIYRILARSGSLPIHLNLATLEPRAHAVSTPVISIWDRCRTRVKSIRLNIDLTDVSRLTSLNQETFPVLRSLDVNVRDAEAVDPGVAAMLSAFNDAPSLDIVNITADSPRTESLLSALPWFQLTALHLQICIDLLEARDILVQCHKLQSA
ncbi:hypothetical protein B0H17DRAFT_389621, partial [Mycena rosella]